MVPSFFAPKNDHFDERSRPLVQNCLLTHQPIKVKSKIFFILT